MSLDFVAIDFETANSFRGSPCSVGLVRVRDGVVADSKEMLIRPPVGADHFDQFNVNIHHITPQDVEGQPRWRDRLPEIRDFIGDDVVVAHNAQFDIGVIRYACAAAGIACPEMRFACSLAFARRHLVLPSYRLPFVLEAYGSSIPDHHNALADAQAVATILQHLSDQLGVDTVDDVATRLGIAIGHMTVETYQGAISIRSSGSHSSHLVIADANPDADPDGYLYGRVVVFTGKLMAMSRQDAWNAVSNAGGAPGKGITKKTNVLVLGDFNPASLRPGATYSAKVRKAFELQDKGQDIELMTEADFLQVLDGHEMLTDELAGLLSSNPDLAPPRSKPQDNLPNSRT